MRIKIAGEFREPKCYDCISIDVDERGVATVNLKAPTFHEWWESITGSPDAFIKNAIIENFPDKCRKEIWEVIQLCRNAGYYLDKYVN